MSHEDMRWWVSYLATSGTTMWCDHCGMLHVSQLPAMATLLNMVPFCLMLSLAMHKWLRFTNIIISYDLFLRISLSALIQRLRLSEAAWYSWSLIDREITVYQSLSTCYCPWYSLKYCFVVKLNKIDVGKLWITSYANMLCCACHTGLVCVTLFELLYTVLSPTTKPSCRALFPPALPHSCLMIVSCVRSIIVEGSSTHVDERFSCANNY